MRPNFCLVIVIFEMALRYRTNTKSSCFTAQYVTETMDYLYQMLLQNWI